MPGEPLDPDKTREAFDALRTRVEEVRHIAVLAKREAHRTDLNLENTRLDSHAAHAAAKVCQHESAGYWKLLEQVLEDVRALRDRVAKLEAKDAEGP